MWTFLIFQRLLGSDKRELSNKTFVYYSGILISLSIQQYSTISTYSWLFFIHPLSSLIQKIQCHYFRLVYKLRLVRRKPPFYPVAQPNWVQTSVAEWKTSSVSVWCLEVPNVILAIKVRFSPLGEQIVLLLVKVVTVEII